MKKNNQGTTIYVLKYTEVFSARESSINHKETHTLFAKYSYDEAVKSLHSIHSLMIKPQLGKFNCLINGRVEESKDSVTVYKICSKLTGKTETNISQTKLYTFGIDAIKIS